MTLADDSGAPTGYLRYGNRFAISGDDHYMCSKRRPLV